MFAYITYPFGRIEFKTTFFKNKYTFCSIHLSCSHVLYRTWIDFLSGSISAKAPHIWIYLVISHNNRPSRHVMSFYICSPTPSLLLIMINIPTWPNSKTVRVSMSSPINHADISLGINFLQLSISRWSMLHVKKAKRVFWIRRYEVARRSYGGAWDQPTPLLMLIWV